MVELTAEELQRLRVVVAEAMGFKWLVQRSHDKRAGFTGRFLYRLEWEHDENRTWSKEWEVWDGKEDIPLFSDALRNVPDFPNDPAQIGPMVEHFRQQWEPEPLNSRMFWDIYSESDGWCAEIKAILRLHPEGKGNASTLECAIALAIADYIGKGKSY